MKKRIILIVISKALFGSCNEKDDNPLSLKESAALKVAIQNIGFECKLNSNVTLNIPSGASSLKLFFPGNSYEYTFTAEADQRLSFTIILVQSNDQFIGTDDWVLELFDRKEVPISGDIISFLSLSNPSNEVNEKRGIGFNQTLRQRGPNKGNVENVSIGLLNDVRYPELINSLWL